MSVMAAAPAAAAASGLLGMSSADAGLLGGLVQGGSSLLGGLIGQSGQAASNAQQIAADQQMQQAQFQYNDIQAGVQRDWAAGQAESQRNWQEFMSDTAYQRQMQDMKLAGLNPILAAGSMGGASTPSGGVIGTSGASGGGGSVGSLGNPGAMLGQGIANAGQMATTMSQIKLAAEQANRESSQSDLNVKVGKYHDAAAEQTKALTANVGLTADEIRARTGAADSASVASRASAAADAANAALTAARTNTEIHNARRAAADADITEIRRDRDKSLGTPAQSIPGGVAQDIGQFAGNILNSIRDMFKSGQTGSNTPNSAKAVPKGLPQSQVAPSPYSGPFP